MSEQRDPRSAQGRRPARPAAPGRGGNRPPAGTGGQYRVPPGHRPPPPAEVPLLTHDGVSGGYPPGAGAPRPARAVAVAERPPARPSGRGGGGGGGAKRPGRPGFRRRVRRIVYVLAGLAVVGPVLAFVLGWLLLEVPTAQNTAVSQVATFTFADGSPLATVRPDNVNRVVVPLDRVPEHVRQAVLSAEDRSFYSNPGFDITGIGRAAWNQLTGGSGGGSTITQQYVKVSTGQDAFSLWRKYKEIVLAVKISREQSKDQILENYLNVIYLGRGAYGVQAASQAYFGKDVDRLSVSEGAMLAGTIQSPSRWDPAENPDKSVERWNFVLDGMVAQKWLSPTDRAAQQFPEWLPEAPRQAGIPGDDRGHIFNKAKEELEARGITEQEINTEGLTVTTTIDPDKQKEAVDAVDQALRRQPDNLRAALVSIDPKTGAVVAYYGGANGVGTDYAEALRQPGSAFKPFVLAAAMQADPSIGLGSTYDGSSPQTFEGVEVQNSEGFSCASCTVQTAMTRSVNTVFYRMGLDVGPQRVADVAHKAGIPANLLPDPTGGISLGDKEVHAIDMASAFATLAADGVRREPYLVTKVTAADGRVLFDRGATPGEQAIPQQVARNVTEAMKDVASTAGIAVSGGRPTAAKTGTVQHPTLQKQNKDAWTVGYTPSLSTAVWIGTDTSEPIKDRAGRAVYGRMLPGSIWQGYMNDALRGTRQEQFSRFVPLGAPPVAEVVVDEDSSGDASATSAPSSEDGSDRFRRDAEERLGDLADRLRDRGGRGGDSDGDSGSDSSGGDSDGGSGSDSGRDGGGRDSSERSGGSDESDGER